MKQAFTLVEVAVTLAVLALVVATVTSGAYLLEVSKLYATISEVNKYQTVVGAFKQKYHALPGDISNATGFFLSTTNGNGNEQISYSGGPNGNEGLRAWQHLNLSKMMEGKYSGVGTGTGDQADIGSNVPQSTYNARGVLVGYGIKYSPDNTTVTGGTALPYNYFVLGAATTNDINNTAGVEATHAQFIDKKTDDNMPQTGNVIEPSAACVTGTGTAAVYKPSDSSGCILYFRVEPE